MSERRSVEGMQVQTGSAQPNSIRERVNLSQTLLSAHTTAVSVVKQNVLSHVTGLGHQHAGVLSAVQFVPRGPQVDVLFVGGQLVKSLASLSDDKNGFVVHVLHHVAPDLDRQVHC